MWSVLGVECGRTWQGAGYIRNAKCGTFRTPSCPSQRQRLRAAHYTWPTAHQSSIIQPACASSGCPCNKCLPRTCSLALSYPRVVATKRSRRRMRWMSTLISCCCCCGCRTGGPACGRQFPPQSPWLWMGDVISPAHSSSPAATLLFSCAFLQSFPPVAHTRLWLRQAAPSAAPALQLHHRIQRGPPAAGLISSSSCTGGVRGMAGRCWRPQGKKESKPTVVRGICGIYLNFFKEKLEDHNM